MVARSCEHGLQSGGHGAFSGAGQFVRLHRTWLALGRRLLLDFFECAAGENGAVVLVDDPGGVFSCVFVFDEKPFVAFFGVVKLDENEAAAEFFSIKTEFDFSSL